MKKIFAILLMMPLFVACSSDSDNGDEIVLKDKTITLNSLDKYQIEANLNGLNYSTQNEDVAIVNNEGLVTATFIGQTEIIVKKGASIGRLKVIVEPKHNLYETPNLNFGISKDDIIKKYGKPSEDKGVSIGYNISGKTISSMMYIFDDNMKLKSSAVIVKGVYSKDLIPFLTERYFPISTEELMFANSTNPKKVTMIVALKTDNTSTLVMYYPSAKL